MPTPCRIFLAYARSDAKLLKQLRTQLDVLVRSERCEIFYDGKIIPGEYWDQRIKDELRRANIYVLLVSADFLASDYVHEVEMPRLLERVREHKASVVPVIVRDCLWQENQDLRERQAILQNGKPIKGDSGYAHAAREIAKIVRQFLENAPPAADPFEELMVRIEGGSFEMGSAEFEDEKPVHTASVGSFFICRHPVLQGQWKGIEAESANPSFFKGDDALPVESVSWQDAYNFIAKLNKRTGKKYRLPSETEWEYAARGGNQGRGFRFAGSEVPRQVAWFHANANGRTHPSGQKLPNELGLFDLCGNVWEWCQDAWHENHDGAPADGSPREGSGSQPQRVLRGGSWENDHLFCRVSSRLHYSWSKKFSHLGFRLTLDGGG